ncbi:polyamine ABC transporter ATP-binding protein, partial [Enterococcus faecalis]
DAKLREEMQIELRALQHRVGVTTIMVTHDQAEAMTLSDRVVLMNKGCIEQIGRPYDMYEQPNGRFSSTFLGKANVFAGTR